MDETTTDAATQDPGVTPAETQPEEQPAEAVTTPDSEPQQQLTQSTEEPSAPASAANDTDSLAEYWNKKGIDISTPEGQAKAAQSYRELEQAFSRKGQEASELKKSLVDQPVTVDSDNELVQSLASEVVTMKRQASIDSFVSKVNLTTEQEQAFAKYIMDTGKAELINGGYLSLEDAYKLSGVGDVDPSQYKSQGKQEALQQLSNKQTATVPKGNASQRTTPPAEDPILNVLQSD